MNRKPGWGLLICLVLMVLAGMGAARYLAGPGLAAQAALIACIILIPVMVGAWLRANEVALLSEGAERNDVYRMTTYEYGQVLLVDERHRRQPAEISEAEALS